MARQKGRSAQIKVSLRPVSTAKVVIEARDFCLRCFVGSDRSALTNASIVKYSTKRVVVYTELSVGFFTKL